MSTNNIAAFHSDSAAIYKIIVQGKVSEDWVNRLCGLAIMTVVKENDAHRTILQGVLRDQSALRGVFETLYALRLPILEIRKIDQPDKNNILG